MNTGGYDKLVDRAAADKSGCRRRKSMIPFISLVLGIFSVIAALGIGFTAYYRSVGTTEQRYLQFYLNIARMLAKEAVLQRDYSDENMLELMAEHWNVIDGLPEDLSFCIIDEDANLLVHSKYSDGGGIYIGESLICGNETMASCTVMDMVKKRKEYVGGYITYLGEILVGVYVPIPERQWGVVVYRSRAAILDEIRTGVRPLLVGLLIVCGVMIPASMALLYGTFHVSQSRRKTAEESLMQSERKYRNLLESLPQKIFYKNTGSFYVSCNENYASELGIDPAEIAGKTDFNFFPDQLADKYRYDDSRVIASGETLEVEEDYVSNGKMSTVHTVKTPVFDENGAISGVLGIFWDITERKNTEMEREELLRILDARNSEMQSIVYVSSHDLKSPLVNIEGFGGMLNNSCKRLRRLLKHEQISDQVKEQVNTLVREHIPESVDFIRAGTSQMRMLIDGLLKISRVGTVEIKREVIDMNEVVSELLDMVNFQVEEAGAVITCDSLPECVCDKNQIKQLFGNLIDNAIKYLRPDCQGIIHISGRKTGNKIEYCIQDNGIGIAENHQQKIFEIYHRLNPEDTVSGEGLGLAIIRRILNRHNGDIRVESEPGIGSKFFVSLRNKL